MANGQIIRVTMSLPEATADDRHTVGAVPSNEWR